ncbi:MAG: hypothetical protein KF799_00930 [Bdellovibrionales bacterium]|nr:hypothetical protein [Bdellovibrionales bacterium]
MNKRFLYIAGLSLLVLLLWRLNTSRPETKVSEQSSQQPSSQNETAKSAPQVAVPSAAAKSSPTAQPVAPSADFNPRASAIRAFRHKQQEAAQSGAAPSVSPVFNSLPKSGVRRINQRPFQILAARAVPRAQYSASMGDILVEQNGFAIVELDPAAGDRWRDLSWNEIDRPVLINSTSGRLAIVTGTLVVKLKEISSADRVASQENLTVAAIDEATRTVYYRAPAGYLMLAGQQRLTQNADVEYVDIELYQARKEAQ